jgi:hypothetical protein
VRQTKNAYEVIVGKFEGKGKLRRPKQRWARNTKRMLENWV